MRLEIDYLVSQLKQLDTLIDEKNAESQKVKKENKVYEEEIRSVNEELKKKNV